MSTPEVGSGFAIPPGEYRPEALAPLIHHPDIAAETASENTLLSTIPSFATMARVALAHGDIPTYEEWATLLEQYIDTSQLQEVRYDSRQFYGYLAECYFYGAARGNAAAAHKLSVMLQTDHIGYRMPTIMKLCAENETPPAQWIADHAHTPDQRANAWSDYMEARKIWAAQLGRNLPPAELATPGTERYVQDFLYGQLSPESTLRAGAHVLQLATDPSEKQRIVDRFSMTITELRSHLPRQVYWLRNMQKFATQVNQDPDISLSHKQQLEREVREATADIPGLPPGDLYELDASAAAARGESPQQIIERATPTEPESPNQRTYRDLALHAASRTYVALGNFSAARTVLSAINTSFVWRSALDYYAQNGGSLAPVREANSARQILEALDPQSPAQEVEWGTRADEIAFIQGLSERNFAQSEQALLSIVDRMRAAQSRERLVIVELAHRLLYHNPTSAHIGPELIRRITEIPNFTYDSYIYNLLTAYRAPNAAQTNRDFVEGRAVAFGRVAYFSLYAGAALAETGQYRHYH